MLLTVDLERLDVQPGHRLLDAGCGEGRHCFGAMARGATVVGLDLDLDSMRDPSKILRKRGEELDRMGVMLQGDAFHLPFDDQRYTNLGKKLHRRHLSADCQKLLHKAGSLVEVNVMEDPHYHVADDELGG